MLKKELLAKSTIATWALIEERVDSLLGNKPHSKILLTEFFNEDTVKMTCFLTNLFEIYFPVMSQSYGLNVIGGDMNQKDYDFLIDNKKVELKTTIGKDLSHFTGSSGQNKEGADHFMLQRYKWSKTRNIPEELCLWWTESFSKMPVSRDRFRDICDTANKAGNTSFAAIKIAAVESKFVTPIIGGKTEFGGVNGKLPLKWLQQVMETPDYDSVK